MIMLRSARKQKGAVLAIFVIGMVAIIALAGLALDVSHAYVDKTRLQNALDAAALSGAMTLINTGGNTGNATTDALATLGEDLTGTELAGVTPTVEFSPTLVPFASGTPPRFVRVKLRDSNKFNMKTWLTTIIGKDTIRVGVSAVAGPVNATPCNLTPLVVCGDPADPDCEVNGHDVDGIDDGMCYGYKVWAEGDPVEDQEECYLKTGTGGGNSDIQDTGVNCGSQTGDGTGTGQESDIGPGNFQLLDLSKLDQIGGDVECDGGGASFLRCAFCKDVHICPDTTPCTEPGYEDKNCIPTKPGNTVGPTASGINTNFGEYHGGGVDAEECPADTVPEPGLYSDYLDANGDQGNGRRIKSIAIGDCTGTSGGQGDVPILTIGCFFLTQLAEQSGQQRVWGQFVGGGCSGSEITLGQSFSQKIILYKDPDSNDS